MSDMSFKQAKELIDKIELTEISLKKTVKDIDTASKTFSQKLKQQRMIYEMIPVINKKLNIMRFLFALNFGFILGLLVGKYIL